MALPTVPGLVSQAVESTSVNTPPSVLPQYSVSTGPHHSIMRCFTCGAIGAAPWSTVDSDDRSERRPLLVGQAQQADAHRRDDVAVADLPLLDQAQALGLVPPGHEHQLGPVGQVDRREAERGGVVQRTGDEVRALPSRPRSDPGRRPDGEGGAQGLDWRRRFTPFGRPVVPEV